MAQEIRSFTFTVPAGITSDAPAILDMTFPPREVRGIEIVIPPGANGVVGFQLQNSGLPVIPYDSDSWIITNDEVISWPLSGYINSGSWQIAGYNTGVNDHAVYIRFLLDLVAPVAGPSTSLSAVATLTSTDDDSAIIAAGGLVDQSSVGVGLDSVL